MTYELRIGTASGKGDVLFGHALADGTRRNLLDGNIGHLRRYIFDTNSLPIGQYYIAVQAIYAGNMGGEWSDEFVYNHQQIAAPVIAHIPSAYSTVDTISTVSVQGHSSIGFPFTIIIFVASSLIIMDIWILPFREKVDLQY